MSDYHFLIYFTTPTGELNDDEQDALFDAGFGRPDYQGQTPDGRRYLGVFREHFVEYDEVARYAIEELKAAVPTIEVLGWEPA